MKKILLSLSLIALGGPAFAGFTQSVTGQGKTRFALNRPSVQEGLGNSAATERFTPNGAGQMERGVACFETIYLSVSATATTGTLFTSGGPYGNTDWIDATAWSDLVVETNFNGGCATLLVESCNTWTITGVAVNPASTAISTLSTIIGATAVTTPVQTHITFFGKYVRFRISDNNASMSNNALGVKMSSTITCGAIFRLL